MTVPFNARTCHQALIAHIEKMTSHPDVRAIVASKDIRRIVARSMAIVSEQVSEHAPADILNLNIARQTWFGNLPVIMDIAKAIARTMRTPELLVPAQLFFAAAHGIEEAGAADLLAETGTVAFMLAFAKLKAVAKRKTALTAGERVTAAMIVSGSSFSMSLEESFDIPPKEAVKICDGSMTIAEVLNKYPQVILLPMNREEPEAPVCQGRKCCKAKKRRKPAK